MRIALVGFGAIGSSVAALSGQWPGAAITHVVVRASGDADMRARVAAVLPDAAVVDAVPTDGVDLVVEAAGHAAVEQHVLPALRRGQPCVMVSIGALSAPGLPEQLAQAAAMGGTQVELVSGAIGAIDALAAARVGGLARVCYTGRKPARAWQGTPAAQQFDLDALDAPQVIFAGSAREAVSLYPKNANVAATVSLAGLGMDDTEVQLIADPHSTENIHQLEASGAFGRFTLTISNQPLPANPKTSALTVYSLARAIHNRVGPVVV